MVKYSIALEFECTIIVLEVISMLSIDFQVNNCEYENEMLIKKILHSNMEGCFSIVADHSSAGSLLFILKGSGILHLNEERLCFQEHNVIMLNNDCFASFETSSFEFLQITINKTELFTKFPPKGVHVIYKLDERPLIVSKLTEILSEYTEKNIHYQAISEHVFRSIMLCIMRDLGINSFESVRYYEQTLINSVKMFFEKNYAQNISIESLASNFYVSKSYLSHAFKQQVRISPINYLISIRITTAQRLLASTDLSVQEISEKVGYVNSNYFSLLFKKLTTKSPTEFRLNARRRV